MILNEGFQITAPSEILVNKHILPVQSKGSAAFSFRDMVFPVANAVTTVSRDMTALRRTDELVHVDFTLHGAFSSSIRGLILAAAELVNVKTFDCNLLWVHVSNKAYARWCNLRQLSVHCHWGGQRDTQMWSAPRAFCWVNVTVRSDGSHQQISKNL